MELKQILHLKVGCSNFSSVRDRGSLPYFIKWGKWPNLEQGLNSNGQLSDAISALILPIELQDHHQPTRRNCMNGLIMIFRFFGVWIELNQILCSKVGCSKFDPV